MNLSFIQDLDTTGNLWSLDPVSEDILERNIQTIRHVEHMAAVDRLRAPHIIVCPEAEANMVRRREGSATGEFFRLIADPFEDVIEVAAKHLMERHSYRQIPRIFSTLDMLYRQDGKEVQQDLVWTVALYGDPMSGSYVAVKAALPLVQFESMSERHTFSRVQIKDSHARLYRPACTVLSVVLVGGRPG